MAPVTQLAWEESRKVTVEAMSRAVPMRPRGWKESNPARVWSIWSLGMNPSYRGVLTTAGATALTRILGASSIRSYGRRAKTRTDHLRLAAQYLGWRAPTTLELKELDEFLLARAMEHDPPTLLFRSVIHDTGLNSPLVSLGAAGLLK
jgi:hypothetical protein